MKKTIYIISISIFVFLLYLFVDPLAKIHVLKKDSYELKLTDMNKRNHPPLFKPFQKYIDTGKYFIHPSTNVPAKGIFLFKKPYLLDLLFSIQNGSPCGDIEFIVKKNGEEVKKFIVTTIKKYRLKIEVDKDDTIEIIADKHGDSSGDWGNLKISWYEPNYILKLIIIPILWIIFIIYLTYKGYVYIALNSYIGFILTILAEKITFGYLWFSDISVYSAFFFLFAFVFVLIYQELNRLKKYKIATILKLITTLIIYIIPISFIVFFLVFHKSIEWHILFAIYQTNFNEAIEFIETFIPIIYLFGVALLILFMGFLFWKQEVKDKIKIERSLLIFIIILLIGFSSEHLLKVGIVNLIYTTYSDYNRQINRLIEFNKKRKASKIDFSATKEEKGELYVVVIGESLNRYNMGIYGYFRDTTPMQLEQVKNDNLQVFKNVYSNAGNTMQSLSLALTEANQYNNKNYLESLSFIDIFNKAGFDTYWLSTQDILGKTNTLISIMARSSDYVIDLTNKVDPKTGNTTYFDENAIEELRTRTSKNKNTLVIIHLYGNHYRYKDRYPEEYEKYKLTTPLLIGTSKKNILNDYTTYDNSVYYNDYVVSSLLDIVKKHNNVSCFIYVADHAEDIVRHRGHTSRPESFTFGMVHIPFTAWLSPKYIEKYPNTYKTFISHKEKLFSNDMLYDTIIGLAHIKTTHYSGMYDLSSIKYNLDPKNAMTLHGSLPYTSEKNYYYWREYNTKLLGDKNIIKKAIVANIDTVGKLNEAWELGYRSFELNLKYIKSKKSFCISNKFDSKGSNIIDLLSYFDVNKIEKLFFNLTDITTLNIEFILKRLKKINDQLKIKQKVYLLVNQSSLIERLKKEGWKVSLTKNKNFKITNYTLNLADKSLYKKLKNMQDLNKDKVEFLFVNFPSVYDE